MALLTLASLTKDLTQGFKQVVGKDWPIVEDCAQKSSTASAHCLVEIEILKVKGKLTNKQAQTMLNIEKDFINFIEGDRYVITI